MFFCAQNQRLGGRTQACERVRPRTDSQHNAVNYIDISWKQSIFTGVSNTSWSFHACAEAMCDHDVCMNSRGAWQPRSGPIPTLNQANVSGLTYLSGIFHGVSDIGLNERRAQLRPSAAHFRFDTVIEFDLISSFTRDFLQGCVHLPILLRSLHCQP